MIRLGFEYGEIEKTEDSVKTTPQQYDWLGKKGFTLKICSSTNAADKRFERIEPWQI